MKLKANILLPSTLILIMLASCKRDPNQMWEHAPATVAATGKADVLNYVITAPLTTATPAVVTGFSRIDTTGLQAADVVGVTMLGLYDSTVVAGNKKYTSGSAGKLAPQNGELVNYPANGTRVSFVATYPYQAGADSVYQISLSNQTNPNAIDFMYAAPATNFNVESRTTPYLKLEHQLAKVELNIIKPAGLTADLRGLEVTLKQQSVTANFNLKTGTFTNQIAGNIKPVMTQGATDTVYKTTLFLLPEKVDGNAIEVKLASGRIFDMVFPVGATVSKGRTSRFDIVLQPVQRTIFMESFGTANVAANPGFNVYTGYDNGQGVTITGSGSVRAPGNGMTTNNGRFAGTEQNIRIAGINTTDYGELKVQFKASVASGTFPLNYNNVITVIYNGVTYTVPSTIAVNTSSVSTITVDLPGAASGTGGVLEIIGNKGDAPGVFFRIDDVSILGKK